MEFVQKIKKKSLLSVVFLLLAVSLFAKESVLLNSNWKFTNSIIIEPQSTNFDDSSWAMVNLPHTWNALDGQDGGNDYFRGIGWYRKHVNVPSNFTGKTMYLKIGAANTTANVYVNGKLVGTHTGGYSAFMFDCTQDLLIGQDNVIAIQVDNSKSILCPPLSADFTFFGGLTRNVELVAANPVHINPNEYISNTLTMEGIRVAQPGVQLKQSNVSGTSADLTILTKLRNASAISANISLEINVKDAAGILIKTLTDAKALPANDTLTSTLATTFSNPHLWDGVNDPYLYRVEVVLKVDGVETDRSVQPLGFRYFSVDSNNGFFLNGKAYPLRGICMHEEKKDHGHAVTDADRREAIDLLAETGMNYFRLSHYQHGDFTYDYLDSLGIICWAEIPAVNSVGLTIEDNRIYRKNAASMMYELLRQQYNHPSIVFWGLCNEIDYQPTIDPLGTVTQLNTIVKSEDTYRFTTLAAMYSERASNWVPDVYSNNRYDGWYYGSIQDFGTTMDALHVKYPTRKIGVSEYGVGANINQHEIPAGLHASGQFHPEEYQNLFHEQYLNMINARPYIWSSSVWAGFDFSSDGRNEGAQPGINDKGLITFDRKVKKDAFYLYKANWNKKDHFVHITSKRYTTRPSLVNPIKIYSNCASVSLKVNGNILETKTATDHLFVWESVTLLEGTNKIEAIGTLNGVEYRDSAVWIATNTIPSPQYPVVPSGQIQINFQKTTTTSTPSGYLKDDGTVFGDRGNGYSYGWNVSNTANGRERGLVEKRFDTFVQMQTTYTWSIALPNQWYKVSIAAGDASYTDSNHKIEANGVLIVDFLPTSTNKFGAGTAYVRVTNGFLSVKQAAGSVNPKIDFIHLTPVTDQEATTATEKIKKKKLMAYVQNDRIYIENRLADNGLVELFDTAGHLIFSKKEMNPNAVIPIKSLPKGVYILQLDHANQNYQLKIVKSS
ncbi:MAG TPA: glycoside hydrolase family 2 TIM barrel-domain containing protein [Bacteroidales bacterium]|nr:glycoside hydrolase family 2 TIM barrel-domain containing protein [Bacteroidales bacterium]